MSRLIPEREAEMRSKYSATWLGHDELWAEIDALRDENKIIIQQFEFYKKQYNLFHEKLIVAIETLDKIYRFADPMHFISPQAVWADQALIKIRDIE